MTKRGFNHLPAVWDELIPAAMDLVEKVTVDIAAGTAADEEIDTGALAASYTASFDDDYMTGYASSNMDYAADHEYGTVHTGAYPHLQDNFHRVAGTLHIRAKHLGKRLEEAARRG